MNMMLPGPAPRRRAQHIPARRRAHRSRDAQLPEAGNFKAFTTTFEDLHGLAQLPGLAVQRLMRDGYGFGAEGDWKTSALVRAMKVMAAGLSGGVSFMEDYTYHFSASGDKVLGAHMLEICESIAQSGQAQTRNPAALDWRQG
jgi:L-arabinose isomerase